VNVRRTGNSHAISIGSFGQRDGRGRLIRIRLALDEQTRKLGS